MAPTGRDHRARNMAGFVLLDVLISLGILAIGSAALYRLHLEALAVSGRTQDRSLMLRTAESLWEQQLFVTRAGPASLRESADTDTFTGIADSFRIESALRPAALPDLYRIRVEVRADRDPRTPPVILSGGAAVTEPLDAIALFDGSGTD